MLVSVSRWQMVRDLAGGVLVLLVWMTLWASVWAAVAGPLSPSKAGWPGPEPARVERAA